MAGLSGPANPNWKGGKWIHSGGYLMVYAPGHPMCNCKNHAPEHLKNYFDFHGEPPGDGWELHHWNGDKLDNDPANLQPLMVGEHQSKGHKSNGGVHGSRIPLVKGSARARELGRKGGKAAARARKKEATRSTRRRRRT